MKNLILIFVLFCVLFLSACAQKNDVVIENIEFTTSFISQGNARLDINWWHSFNNDELTQLVSQGLQSNLSLKASELRLKSSALDARIIEANLYPSLNLSSTASSTFDDFGDINTGSFGVKSSWEIDLWGSIAASENSVFWDHQGQLALYRAQANLVAGSITNVWLSLISEQKKKLVLADQFRRTQDALTVMSRRFAMGKNSVTNIWQQQKLLKTIEVQQEKNRSDLYINQQTLALWLGITTQEMQTSSLNTFPSLPELPKMGIPAKVLQYRPDIEQAFAQIKAANEHLAVAISAQYPRITLTADYKTSKNSVNDLFDDWSGNLIASLAMPLFDAGTKKSVIEQRKLQLKALMMDYQQVWLEAIASVNRVLVIESR